MDEEHGTKDMGEKDGREVRQDRINLSRRIVVTGRRARAEWRWWTSLLLPVLLVRLMDWIMPHLSTGLGALLHQLPGLLAMLWYDQLPGVASGAALALIAMAILSRIRTHTPE